MKVSFNILFEDALAPSSGQPVILAIVEIHLIRSDDAVGVDTDRLVGNDRKTSFPFLFFLFFSLSLFRGAGGGATG